MNHSDSGEMLQLMLYIKHLNRIFSFDEQRLPVVMSKTNSSGLFGLIACSVTLLPGSQIDLQPRTTTHTSLFVTSSCHHTHKAYTCRSQESRKRRTGNSIRALVFALQLTRSCASKCTHSMYVYDNTLLSSPDSDYLFKTATTKSFLEKIHILQSTDPFRHVYM